MASRADDELASDLSSLTVTASSMRAGESVSTNAVAPAPAATTKAGGANAEAASVLARAATMQPGNPTIRAHLLAVRSPG